MDFPGFCGYSYTSQSMLADAEQCINWYPEQIESDAGKTRIALYPTPGLRQFIGNPGRTSTRALYTLDGRTLAVIGDSLYDISAGPTITYRGYVGQDSSLAQIVMNGDAGKQALIGSALNGFCLNLTTNALTQVTTQKSYQVGMLDGFFISFDSLLGRMWLSNNADGTTWDPTQFAQRSAAADRWRAMIVVPPDIWLIGSVTGDIWFDAGAYPFPFAPRQGLNFKYGIAAPMSLAAIGPTVIWLAQAIEGQGIVVRTVGYEPQRVSTYAVETAIAGYARQSTIANAEAMTYVDQGHPFYCLRFPTPERTWVYDLTMNTWHERGYWNPARNQYEVWRPRCHTFALDRHLVGDTQTGIIQEMDISIGTELDGSAIRRLRRTPGVFTQMRQIPIRLIEIYLENGLGLQSGQGSDPLVMWRSSDDGGRTWGNERQGSAGRVGKYRTRLRFWRHGVPRDRVNELTATDPIPWRIIGAYVNNDAGQ
ncbi:MAG TPA: hypothetical protein VKE96_12410 [Vicinamibacterales bacterium]|nr:hypothetical protein [Vicinamibacterales bacterium]